jgi:hypothetical protein
MSPCWTYVPATARRQAEVGREMTVLRFGQRRHLIGALMAELTMGVDSGAFHPRITFYAPLVPGVPADVPSLVLEREAVPAPATLSA